MRKDSHSLGETAGTGCGKRNSFRRLRRQARYVLGAGLLAVAMASPASADFVCNAKTKLVNVFLEPPEYRQNTNQVAPRKLNPADAMEKPFDIVDTLPSGARVKDHGFAGPWTWISFRHTQTGLVGNGYVLSSKLSGIPCDADPKTATGYIDPDDSDYFGRSLDELDDPPLEGARNAKRFETSMLSGAVRTHKVHISCEQPPKDTNPNDLIFRLRACNELLAMNPNYVEGLIHRGDIFHLMAKTPAQGIDSKSPQWMADITRRKEAQEKATADWRRAGLLVGKDFQSQLLGNRLEPTGPAEYQVK